MSNLNLSRKTAVKVEEKDCLIYHLVINSRYLPSVLRRCWLGSWKSTRTVKNRVVGRWQGYLSGVRCRFAYGPNDAAATYCLLLQ